MLYTIDCYSIRKISKITQVNYVKIKKILLENNIVIRDGNFYKSKKVNEEFFESIDTEEKAYWLGYMYADAYITDKIIEIKCIDKEQIENFKKSIQSEHKILEKITDQGFSNNTTFYSIRIVSQKMCCDLKKLNATSPKKFRQVPQLPNELIRHFIRGYFDGDGSVYFIFSKKKNTYETSVSFTGFYPILNYIRNIFIENFNTKANIFPYKNSEVYDYKIGGRNNINDIYNYFYNNANFYMKTKKDKFFYIKNI